MVDMKIHLRHGAVVVGCCRAIGQFLVFIFYFIILCCISIAIITVYVNYVFLVRFGVVQ